MKKLCPLCLSFILAAVVLFSCGESVGTPDTKSDPTDAPETAALTEIPTTAAPESTQAPEEELTVLFFEDDVLSVSRAGNKFSYHKLPNGRTYSFELPSDRNYTDVQVIVGGDGTHYLVAADDTGSCGITELGGRNSIDEFDPSYLEVDGRRFCFRSNLLKTTVIDKDGKLLGIYSGKFMSFELSGGSAVINYFERYLGGDKTEIYALHLCDPETLKPLVFENDSSFRVFGNYQVKEGLLYLIDNISMTLFNGKEVISNRSDRIIYQDEDYYLVSRNYISLLLYDKELNLLCDWGYVGSGKTEVTREGDALTIALNNFNLTYPTVDINIGETFYETDRFRIIRDGSDWYLKTENRNYLVRFDVQSESEPVVGYKKYSDINSHYYFFWKDASKAAEVSVYDGGVSYYFTPQLEKKYDWNRYEVFNLGCFAYIFDENGELALFDVGIFEVKNNFLTVYWPADGGDMSKTYYRPDLTPLTDEPFFTPCDSPAGYEGGVMGIIGKHFEVFDADGNLVKKSRDFDRAMLCAGGYTLALDGEKLKLFDIDENEVAIFEDYYPGLCFHPMISGYYKKEATDKYPAGYYFVFEDNSVTDKDNNYLSVEFYYDPETGETGTVKDYSSFAYAKPVLYLYPEKTTDVTVKFEHPERLTTVYPAYNDGWTVIASPDGNLFDGRRNYYALYWEESSNFEPDFSEGFLVEDNYSEFLEDKLDEIGLSEREANEFIMYWLPILEKNKKSLVYFELTESREAGNALHITPEPDSLLRVAIHIKKADGTENISEQKLEHFDRAGFTAVEWGGAVH